MFNLDSTSRTSCVDKDCPVKVSTITTPNPGTSRWRGKEGVKHPPPGGGEEAWFLFKFEEAGLATCTFTAQPINSLVRGECVGGTWYRERQKILENISYLVANGEPRRLFFWGPTGPAEIHEENVLLHVFSDKDVRGFNLVVGYSSLVQELKSVGNPFHNAEAFLGRQHLIIPALTLAFEPLAQGARIRQPLWFERNGPHVLTNPGHAADILVRVVPLLQLPEDILFRAWTLCWAKTPGLSVWTPLPENDFSILRNLSTHAMCHASRVGAIFFEQFYQACTTFSRGFDIVRGL